MSALEKAILEILRVFCETHHSSECGIIIQRRIDELGKGRATLSFEEWLSHLVTADHLLSTEGGPLRQLPFGEVDPIEPNSLGDMLRTAEKAIFALCSLRLADLTQGATGHHALLAKLVARDPTLGRAHVFTTNYDTLVEQALDHLAIQYSDGFVGTIERRFDPSCYGLDLYYPGEVSEGRVRRFDKFLHLYKLHGSVHWACGSELRMVQTTDPALAACAQWRALTESKERVAKLDQLYPDNRGRLGVFPTANKYAQTLGLPFAHLFRAFHQRLQVPQTFLLTVGYSFSDAHINAVIDDAMTNPGIVLLTVDPFAGGNIEDRVRKYQYAGERAFVLTGDNELGKEPQFATLPDFAKNLMPNVQWIEDFVKLRKVERVVREGQQETDQEPRHD